MLEHVPGWLGSLLREVRAGHAKLVVARRGVAMADGRIDLTSPAFHNGQRLPVRFTADGEGVSPPLAWGELPTGTRSLALIVEDPDAPAPNPLVHAVVMNVPPDQHALDEGAINANGHGDDYGANVGRNSFFAEGWLPPDPPTGHGEHDYVFQLFALDAVPDVKPSGGRDDLVTTITGHVLGTGLLVGTCAREACDGISLFDRGGASVSVA